MAYDYDIVVIGGGAAGLTAAKAAVRMYKKVALIEKDRLGGGCTWTGCVPSKTLIKSAETAYFAHLFKKRGLQGNCPDIDSSFVLNHVRQTSQRIYELNTAQMLEEEGITVIEGCPEFITPHDLLVNGKPITFKKAIIATGSRATIPLIPGIDEVAYVTNETFFLLEKFPKSMIILGGGPIACEIGSALNRLATRITIIESNAYILGKNDVECIEVITQAMTKEGVQIITNACIVRVYKKSEQVIGVVYRNPDGTTSEVEAEMLFIAAGRTANTDGLGLEKIGVNICHSYIITDTYMRSSIPNIYAAGDVTGPYLFAHMAWHQAAVAARNASIPFFKKRMDYTQLAWVTFTAPEIAGIGLTEAQARAAYGDRIDIIRIPYSQLDRAIMDATEVGLGKFICDRKGNLLGAHIVGERAGELISALQIGKTFRMSFMRVIDTVIPYPTYTELLWHGSKRAYINHLERSIVMKIIRWFYKQRERK